MVMVTIGMVMVTMWTVMVTMYGDGHCVVCGGCHGVDDGHWVDGSDGGYSDGGGHYGDAQSSVYDQNLCGDALRVTQVLQHQPLTGPASRTAVQ